MTFEDAMQFICILLTGAATCIPLALRLCQYVRLAVQQGNWTRLLDLVMELMEEAEELFGSGAERKAYVLTAAEKLSYKVNYDIDSESLSALIDALCAMSKKINGK